MNPKGFTKFKEEKLMNSKNTKRALVSSALAMLVCVAMLIGTTFAWFTDTASTGVNKITSGNLDVQIQDKAGKEIDTLEWVKEDGTVIADQDAILWEPGCTYLLTPFKIANVGNLALKYKIVVTGLEGDSILRDVIKFTYKTEDGNVFDMNAEGHLTAKGTDGAETKMITVSAHMDETAGNDYMNKELKNASSPFMPRRTPLKTTAITIPMTRTPSMPLPSPPPPSCPLPSPQAKTWF